MRIVDVKALPKYHLWIKFQDGKEGTVDLSELVGKGVFAKWKESGFFQSAFVDKESGTVAWPGGLDLSPEVLYEDITGKNPLKAPRA